MTAHIWIYGIIGDTPKGATEKYYSFQDFRSELTPDATDYVVHIFSPGGDVFQGAAIYNGLKNSGKPVKVLIEGVCASIATLIAGAADPGKLIMNAQSQWMVHNPKFNNISGDSQELRTGADQLDQIKTLLINVYRKRTGLSEQALWEVLNKETWMLPDQAKALGFVDEVVESMKAVAYADLNFLTEMENKNEIIAAIENLGKRISAIWKSPKNMTVTTTDNVVLVIQSEDGEWVGKQVSTEDGQPLVPGSYTLSDGTVLVVGDQSTIAEVTKAEAKTEDVENQDDMKATEELVAAKARIKELESALEATKNSAQESNALVQEEQAKVKTLENKMNGEIKNLKDELEKIKNITAGDDSKPDLGVKKQVNDGKPPAMDPMQKWFGEKFMDRIKKD